MNKTPSDESLSHHRGATWYFREFCALVFFDGVLLVWHALLIGKNVYDEHEVVLIGLAIATAHFLANTIAIADIFAHLWKYTDTGSCVEFEPAKSINCFMFSVIGGYADLATIALAMASKDETVVISLYYAMFLQSVLCAFTSVRLYIWANNAARRCSDENRDDSKNNISVRPALKWDDDVYRRRND